MPKSIVTRVQCDRCKSVKYEDFNQSSTEELEPASLKLTLTMPGKKGKQTIRSVEYPVLCEGCQTTVSNYIDGIDKSKAKKGDAAEGAPKDPQAEKPTKERDA